MGLFYSSLLGQLSKEVNIQPTFSFFFFNFKRKEAGKYWHELKNQVMARDFIVLKRYVMWLEVESFLLTIFFIYKTLYIMFLCVEFFLKKYFTWIFM